MLKKLLIVFFLLLFCIVSMTSCFVVVNKDNVNTDGNGGKETTQTTDKPQKVPPMADVLEGALEKSEEALSKAFADKNFQNQSFTVTMAHDTFVKLGASQETTFLRALQLQSQLISGKLNCTLYTNRFPYSSILSDTKTAIDTGAFYADVLIVPQKSIGYLRQNGVLYDLKELYEDALGEEDCDVNNTLQLLGGNSLYGLAGNGVLSPGAYYCVYFNKDITDSFNLTSEMYDCAKSENWTLPSMIENGRKCVGENVFITGAETQELFIESLFSASGMKYFNTEANGLPTVKDNGDRFGNFVEYIRQLILSGELIIGDDAFDMFKNGKSVFYIDTLDKALELNNNFGILPLPKFDTEQGAYYTHTSGEALVFTVPKTGARTEYSLDLIKAYNRTAELIKDAWARDYLDNVLRDPQSYSMLKIIFENVSYDFAYMYGELYPSVADSSYNALKKAVEGQDTFENNVKANKAQFDKDMNALFAK